MNVRRIFRELTLALVLTGCMSPLLGGAEEQCLTVTFADGASVSIRKEKIKSVNAVMEWPAAQTHSVTVAAPSSSADVAAILISSAIQQKAAPIGMTCFRISAGMRCEETLDQPLVRVSIVLRADAHDQRAVQSMVDYVKREVLSCPR
jgi:hypothetical protein